MISNTKNIVYDLPHKLPQDLKLKILGNQETLQKYQKNVKIGWRQSLVPRKSSRNKSICNSSQKLRKIRYQSFLLLFQLLTILYSIVGIFENSVAISKWIAHSSYFNMAFLAGSVGKKLDKSLIEQYGNYKPHFCYGYGHLGETKFSFFDAKHSNIT